MNPYANHKPCFWQNLFGSVVTFGFAAPLCLVINHGLLYYGNIVWLTEGGISKVAWWGVLCAIAMTPLGVMAEREHSNNN